MKQQKHRTKILSFVLSVLMLLGVPLPAFAQAALENAIEEAQNQPVLMTDKLTETETYWQNADGSITYESHLEPIRYQDEEETGTILSTTWYRWTRARKAKIRLREGL